MILINKIEMRKLYRGVIYAFAAYGLLKSPFCATNAHGAELDGLKPTKQIVMKYDKAGELEKVVDSYKLPAQN